MSTEKTIRTDEEVQYLIDAIQKLIVGHVKLNHSDGATHSDSCVTCHTFCFHLEKMKKEGHTWGL